MPQSRALIVVRLSRLTDESTSPERQRAECERFCAAKGWDVVGVAEDLDVSAGSTSPFDRPALSRWLGDGRDDPGRLGEFDVIVVYRVDRLVRRVRHLSTLIDWAEDHAINIVSATETHFDLSTAVGRVIAQLVASFGEMELEAISERNSSAFRHNIAAGKWRGGVPPWGYLPRVDDAGDWRLFQDPEQVAVIREVLERVLEGEPLASVARDLTAREISTPRDRFAVSQGRDPKGYQWHAGALKRSLESETLLGHAVTREALIGAQGRVQKDSRGRKLFGPEAAVRGDDGSPIVRAEPVLTRDEFDRVGKELAGRENRKEPNARTNSLLLGVISCGVCGKPCYKLKGANGRQDRYRCRSVQEGSPCCANPSTPVGYVEDAVETMVLGIIGDSERLARTWDPGDDNTAELTELEATLADLASQLGVGPYRAGTPQRRVLDERIASLSERYDDLSSSTSRAAGWTWTPTGERFSDWWETQDVVERNVWLRASLVSVEFEYREPKARGDEPVVRIELGDVPRMLTGVGSDRGNEVLAVVSGTTGLAGVEIKPNGEIVAHARSGDRIQID